MEEVQMLSCLDFLKERLGDKYDIQAAQKAVLGHKFDAEKALDVLLQKNTAQPTLPTLPKAKAYIPPQTTGMYFKHSIQKYYPAEQNRSNFPVLFEIMYSLRNNHGTRALSLLQFATLLR